MKCRLWTQLFCFLGFFLTFVETSTLNPFMFAADFFLKHTFSYVAVM